MPPDPMWFSSVNVLCKARAVLRRACAQRHASVCLSSVSPYHRRKHAIVYPATSLVDYFNGRRRLTRLEAGGVRQGSRGTYLLSQLAEFHTFSRL